MVLNILWYFIIISFFGWLTNGIKTLFSDKKFYNKGFLTSPFCPSYGFGAVLCYQLLKEIDNNLLLFFSCTVILSIFALFIAMIIERVLGVKPWDFSNQSLSIGSYLTVGFALHLGLLGFVFVKLIPLIDVFMEQLPQNFAFGFAIILSIIIIIDYMLTIITTQKLIKKIGAFNNIVRFSDSSIEMDKLLELKQNYKKLFVDNIIRKRLINLFPELKKSSYFKRISEKVDNIKDDNLKEYTTVYSNKKQQPFAFGICFSKLFLLFVIGSFLGTIIEIIWAYMLMSSIEVRVGMVYGPFIPVYGVGACFLTIALHKLYKASDTLLFLISAIVGAGFEYICSWFQETVFGTISWDYSNTPFNLNGRTNLMYALIWGILGLAWVRYLYPFASKYIEKIPKKAGSVMTAFLFLFMIYNAFISSVAVIRWTERSNNICASNKLEVYLDSHFDDERMNYLFPNMMLVND